MSAADVRGCRREAVVGEYAGDGGSGIERNQRQIAAVGLAYAGLGNAEPDAGDGMEGFRGGGRVVDGHDQVGKNRDWK